MFFDFENINVKADNLALLMRYHWEGLVRPTSAHPESVPRRILRIISIVELILIVALLPVISIFGVLVYTGNSG